MANLSLIHKHSDTLNSGGGAVAPSSNSISYGEIALNYAANNETLFVKNNNDEIISLPLRGNSSIQYITLNADTLLPTKNGTYYQVNCEDKDEIILDCSELAYSSIANKPIFLCPNTEKKTSIRFVTIMGLNSSTLDKWQILDFIDTTRSYGADLYTKLYRVNIIGDTCTRCAYKFTLPISSMTGHQCQLFGIGKDIQTIVSNNIIAEDSVRRALKIVYYNSVSQTYRLSTDSPQSNETAVGIQILPKEYASQLVYDSIPNQGIMMAISFPSSSPIGYNQSATMEDIDSETAKDYISQLSVKNFNISNNSKYSIHNIGDDCYATTMANIISIENPQSPVKIEGNTYDAPLLINSGYFAKYEYQKAIVDMDGYTNTEMLLNALPNDNTLKNYINILPIFNNAQNARPKEHWYIPSLGELSCLIAMKQSIKNVLQRIKAGTSAPVVVNLEDLDGLTLLSSTVSENGYLCNATLSGNGWKPTLRNDKITGKIIPFSYIPV